MRCVQMLQRAGVEPLCVFDGDKLPSKAGEEAERERCGAGALRVPAAILCAR